MESKEYIQEVHINNFDLPVIQRMSQVDQFYTNNYFIDITKYAESIFGNIIKSALIPISINSLGTEEQIRKAIRDNINYINDCYKKDNILSVDNIDIVFINDKEVVFNDDCWLIKICAMK